MRKEIPVTYLGGETFRVRPVERPLFSRQVVSQEVRLEGVMIAHLGRDRFDQRYYPGRLRLTLNRMVL